MTQTLPTPLRLASIFVALVILGLTVGAFLLTFFTTSDPLSQRSSITIGLPVVFVLSLVMFRLQVRSAGWLLIMALFLLLSTFWVIG